MAGRGKKRPVSEDELNKAMEYAFNGCQNGTIEGLMDWPGGFISKRKDIARILTKKRQERNNDLRKAQTDMAIKTKNPVMQIFLGKNELGQADKQDIKHGVDKSLQSVMDLIDGKTAGVLPSEEKA